MKRVQAIVTGKKKQCTKLPKPSLKESKTPTATPPQTRSNPGDKAAKGDDTGGKLATSGSVSSTSSTVTAGSSTSAATIIPSSKSTSKIPGTSPKKGSKDGGKGSQSSKFHLRKDNRNGSKSESSNKKSSSSKQKNEAVNESAAPASAKEESDDKLVQKMASVDEQDYVRQNLYTDESRDAKTNDQISTENKPSSTESGTSASGITGPNPPRVSEERPNDEGNTNHKVASTEQKVNRENQRNIPASQQPLHGILKDGSSNGSIYSTNKGHHQDANGHHRNSANIQQHEYPHINSSQSPMRTGSFKGNASPYYQQIYGSLPRTSRSTTPTPENAYNYSSLPRRPHVAAEIQHNVMYNSPHEWALSRKAESDSGFAQTFADRSQSDRNRYATIGYSKGIHGVPGYSNDTYSVVSHKYQNPRSGIALASGNDLHSSSYSMSRPIVMSSSQYFSDTESGRYRGEDVGYHRSVRAGSVPLGYESDSAAYGVIGPGQSRYGSMPRSYDPGTDYGNGSSSNLRVQQGDEQYRAAPGKRPIPRRHTVGASGNRVGTKDSETDKKREAFLQLLAQRYPQYADRIQGATPASVPQPEQPVKPNRSREGQRRRAALVAYNPNVSGNSLEYDDLGTMTDVEVSSFQRGGFSRTSLPIVRSASTSLERPLGLVFLVYGDQTKKSLLPNEITTLDTVRALFVRAFPDLSLEILENPRKKIYLLDPATNIYFQLEDLADIKDRSVLKLHETDNDQPQKVKERQEVRGRTVQMPLSRSHSRQAYGELPAAHSEMFHKSQSLPPQASHIYQDVMHDQRSQWELERRSRSRTPEPAERSQRSQSAGSSSRQRFSHSPDRLPTPERMHLNPIPENRQIPLGYPDQGNYYENVGTGMYRGQYPSGIYDSTLPYQGYPASHIPTQHVACSTRASTTYPQRAIAPGLDMRDSTRGVSMPRNFIPPENGFQRTQSYRHPPSERDGKDLSRSQSVAPADDTARNRIEKMEQQLANLTAWVHYQKDGTRREVVPAPRSLGRATSDSSDTFPASSASSLSDIHDASSGQRSSRVNSRESTPLSAQADIHAKLAQLKSDLHAIRKQQQLNMEAMKNEFVATTLKIQKFLSSLPETQNQESFQKRAEAAITKNSYLDTKQQVDQKIGDLEATVEELRIDAISKQSGVKILDIEKMALLLTNVTKSLADLKGRFNDIYSQMKHVVETEKKILVSEEKFLKEEPTEIENAMKRCKNISDNLSHLKRMSSQKGQHSPPSPPIDSPASDKNKALPKKVEVPSNSGHKVADREIVYTPSRKKEQQEVFTVNRRINVTAKDVQKPSVASVTSEEDDVVMRVKAGSRTQPDQEKPVVPTKYVLSSNAAPVNTVATTTSVSPTTNESSESSNKMISVKPSFPLPSNTAKLQDKPTATVSAMTAGVPDTVTFTAMEHEFNPPVMKNVIIPLTQTTGRLSSTMKSPTDTVSHSPKEGDKSPKKKDSTVYTYQVCGPVNPVFPIPPVFNKEEGLEGTSTSRNSSLEPNNNTTSSSHSENSKLESSRENNRPPNLPLSVKKGSVSFSDPPVTSVAISDSSSSMSTINGHAAEKVDPASSKYTARSAFFSSLSSSSSNSPSSPNRNSASLDHGPVLSPSGVVGKMTEGTTINLALSGSVSPMSPTNPGSFSVASPLELNSNLSENKTSSTTNCPIYSETDNSTVSPDSLDSCNKQKKVPPPPPPRQGSRPTSSSISSVNGLTPDTSVQQSMPRFVGGILGQHRHSGGPLFSTPKPVVELKPRNEQESSNGNCITINQQDVQNQKSSLHRNETDKQSTVKDVGVSSLKYIDRDSGSESSGSSGTMGSQQSVVTVVRSLSASVKDSSKSKPDPPRRHSSLLSKFTGSKESKNKLNNGKAKINGVDF